MEVGSDLIVQSNAPEENEASSLVLGAIKELQDN
jgi:hypothetical protein